MSVAIRPYRPADAAALADLYARSVRELGAGFYSPEQVEAWARTADADRLHERLSDGRTALVAADGGDCPLAFGDLEADGHIDLFYCAPEAAGQGIASRLFDRLEAIAREAGMARLHVEASEAARGFFERKGFRVTARRDLAIAGVAIHNYAMEKAFSGTR